MRYRGELVFDGKVQREVSIDASRPERALHRLVQERLSRLAEAYIMNDTGLLWIYILRPQNGRPMMAQLRHRTVFSKDKTERIFAGNRSIYRRQR